MKKLLALLLPVFVWSQSYMISTIPVPKTYIQNLDIYACDTACMHDLLEREQIFSFLAHATQRLDDEALNDAKMIYTALFNIGAGARHSNELRIAMLLPYPVIGRYAYSTTNAVFAYLLAQNGHFDLKTFQTDDESMVALGRALEEIAQEGFNYVIAPLTPEGAKNVAALNPPLFVYFPTVNHNDVTEHLENFYYGGIDYRAQTDTLLRHTNNKLVIFYDESRLGTQLRDYSMQAFYNQDNGSYDDAPKEVKSYALKNRTSDLKSMLETNRHLQESSVMLNTPVVKSGMVMSQLTLYDANVSTIVSTQINYDPLLLSITQYADRKSMIIANSIGENNRVIEEANALLGNDIAFDWINYATTVAIDYFHHLITGSEREYNIRFENNQAAYPIALVRPSYSRFIPLR